MLETLDADDETLLSDEILLTELSEEDMLLELTDEEETELELDDMLLMLEELMLEAEEAGATAVLTSVVQAVMTVLPLDSQSSLSSPLRQASWLVPPSSVSVPVPPSSSSWALPASSSSLPS